MILYMNGMVTMVPNSPIDVYAIKLSNGIELTWDEMEVKIHRNKITCEKNINDHQMEISGYKFEIKCKGVYFNDEYANGRINEIVGTEIEEMSFPVEIQDDIDIYITETCVKDNDRLENIEGEYALLGMPYDLSSDRTNIRRVMLYNEGKGKEVELSFIVADGVDLYSAIKAAVKEFCWTELGRRIYMDNNNSFNWGDFMQYMPDSICVQHGFKKTKNAEIHLTRMFDEDLVEESDVLNETELFD